MCKLAKACHDTCETAPVSSFRRLSADLPLSPRNLLFSCSAQRFQVPFQIPFEVWGDAVVWNCTPPPGGRCHGLSGVRAFSPPPPSRKFFSSETSERFGGREGDGFGACHAPMPSVSGARKWSLSRRFDCLWPRTLGPRPTPRGGTSANEQRWRLFGGSFVETEWLEFTQVKTECFQFTYGHQKFFHPGVKG